MLLGVTETSTPSLMTIDKIYIDLIHVILIDAPVSLCDQYGYANTCVYIVQSDATSKEMSGPIVF